MTTSLRRCSCRITLAAALTIAAAPALAQPIEAGSQDAFESSTRDEPGRDQARAWRQGRRGSRPTEQELGAASPDLPQPRGYRAAPAHDGYAGDGANGYGGGSGYGTMDQRGDHSGTYDEDRRLPVAPFGGGRGYQTQTPSGVGGMDSFSTFRGTAAGPQYSNQLPTYGGRSGR